ncbi:MULTISPECIES: hypothetical protein [unclassified Rhodanobacter]|uniref:hypothetical protein n=1 Tax=unclassified Rhodanobacter TaxID=2621553 RepID=UPI000B2765BE|nr:MULTISPECIES: hypothetical protein [unclassified Rhodanobacter]
MNIRLTCLALAAVAAGSLFSSQPATAQPNCPTCMAAYYACVASGKTTCDTTYATCLRYCPVAVSAPKPIKRDKSQERAIDNKGAVASLATL